MCNLILQSFGRENEYKRAVFTILSFYTHSTLPLTETKVILFTDKPDYFDRYLKGLPVSFILLTQEKIKTMRGNIDFLHRMKIALIEESFTLTKGSIFYTDSDCFFITDPASILHQVSERRAFMHLMEYPFVKEVEDKTATYENFYELIISQKFILSNGSILQVKPQHYSWNAGVMVFHPSHARFIPDVYCLTDQFYPGSQSHASEQYAFSLILQENLELGACDHIVYHYWYRVKKQIVDIFLNKELTSGWSNMDLQIKLADVKRWTQLLPSLFESHILMIRDHAIQAFNKNNFSEGYKWTAKAIMKNPFNARSFLKDVFYHTRRQLMQK
jgi:hypothetical protein